MLRGFGSRRETPTKLTWSPWIYNELDVICNEQLHPIHCDFSLLQMSVITLSENWLICWTPAKPETSYGFVPVSQSVSQSVCLSVCNHSISRLLHYFFLIFCMKLGYHKGTKLTSPDFLGKFEFGQKWPKTAKNSPKMRFLVFFSKLLHLFFGPTCFTGEVL